jgi:hypothetical protein
VPTAPRLKDTSQLGANLADFVQNTGTADGVSCSAAPHQLPTRSPWPSPAGNPAYITISMIGSKAQSDGSGTSGSGSPSGTGSASTGGSGHTCDTGDTGDGDDAVGARTGGSGVMVSQGVLTLPGGWSSGAATTNSSSSSTATTTDDSASSSTATASAGTAGTGTADADTVHADADGGGADGSGVSSWWAGTKAFFGSIGSSVTYAAQKVDQAVGVVAMAALTGQVVDMESASGVQIAGAFGGGLQTGGKAVVNGTASAAVNTLTLGMVDKNIEVITVTAEDRAIGYDTAAGSAKFGATVLISTLGPGAVTNVAKGFGGARAVCTTGKVLAGLDAAANSVNVGKGVADMRQNGLTFGNALQVGGGLMGLAGNANTILNTACFAAGTPLLTPDGSKFIEDIRVGDLVLSRHEDDPEGPVVAKRVVNLFQNYSPLLDLHVGGRVIRTTAEHPFWIVGRGWTPAQQIMRGDLLLGADNEQTASTLVEGPKESAPVYNLEIEEYHTYLVGSALWGFAVWAHNTGCVTPGGNVVPDYAGGKTSGVLVRPNGVETPLVSGYRGATEGVRGIPRMNGNIKSHVEAQAAAVMRKEGLQEATLYINKVPCPTKDPRSLGCANALEHMLPESSQLRVVGPDGYNQLFTRLPDPPGTRITGF